MRTEGRKDGRTDRYDEANNAFRNFENTPKKRFLNFQTLPYMKNFMEGRHLAFFGNDLFLFITTGRLKKIRLVS